MFLGARLENPKINKREEGGRGGGPNNSGVGEVFIRDLRVCFFEILGLSLRKVGKPLKNVLKKRQKCVS